MAPPSEGLGETLDPRPLRRLSIGATGQGPSGARRYELLAPIARGGMGEVYLAEQTDARGRRRHVIVKRLLESLQEEEEYVAMFKSEAEHLALLDHPNIVKIYDAPTIDGTRCLALEYVRGRSVAQLLDRCRHSKTQIPADLACLIMSEVLAGLDHVHRAAGDDGKPLGLVHRDVTPGNLLVSFDGEVKLTDFGIAKSQMSAVSTTVGIVKGKARYLSPEQILGERATPRSDLFACGCVLYEMLAGTPLFERPTVPRTLTAIVQGELPDLRLVVPAGAPKLLDVLQRSLASQQEKRHIRALDMAMDLIAAARELGQPAGRSRLSEFMGVTFEGQVEPWEEVPPPNQDPPAPKAPVSDPPTVDAQLVGVPSEGRPEPRLRAASIPEDEAVSEPVRAANILVAPELSDDTPAAEPTAIAQAVAKPPPEDTLLVDRARDRDPRTKDPHPTVRIPEPRDPSDPPAEGEEATIAMGPSSPLADAVVAVGDETSARAEDPSDAATAASVSVRPQNLPEEPRVVPRDPAERDESATPQLERQADRFTTRLAPRANEEPRPASATSSGALVELRRILGWIRAPERLHLMVLGAVFVLGTVTGMSLNALFSAESPAEIAPPIAEPPMVPAIDPSLPVVEPGSESGLPVEDDPVALEPQMATVDIPTPRGGRIKIDGVMIKRRAPIKRLELEPGDHEIWIYGKKTKRRVELNLEPGEHVDLDRPETIRAR